MKKRKTIAAFLATFLLFLLVLSTGLQLFQFYLKGRAEERLEEEALVSISVPLSKVTWVEEGREVRIDGEMFDLKNWEEENRTFTALGVWDEKETAVMELLGNFNDEEQTGLVIRMLLVLQTLAFVISASFVSPFLILLTRCFKRWQAAIPLHYLRRIDQPPRSLYSI